jgi:secreted trypsin-like serine protease
MIKARGRRILTAAAAVAGGLVASTGCLAEDPAAELRAAIGADNGMRNTLRIYGGVTASKADWPSFARVVIDLGDGRAGYCGGSIISKRWIATAAHCAHGVSPSAIMAIENIDTVSIGGRRLRIDEVVTHERFYLDMHGAPHNDIALLHLASEARSPAQRLMSTEREAVVVTPGAPSQAAGFGLTLPQSTVGPNVGQASNALQEAELPIYDRRACNTLLARAMHAPNENLVDSTNICAGDPDRVAADTCNGDSGGPLTMDVDGRRAQVGVVSWGAGCAQKGTVGVYTSIGFFEPWIKRYVADAEFGERTMTPPPPSSPATNCGLPSASSDRTLALEIVEGNTQLVGSHIHIRAASGSGGFPLILNVDLTTCKVLRVYPQASGPDFVGAGAFLFPPPNSGTGIRVAPPTGPNRLYAAILPESPDIDALIGASSQSQAVADVSALVRELRARSSAFGAYDYRIEP